MPHPTLHLQTWCKLLSRVVRVRHDVADVAVLLSVERIDSTRCSASGILPGRAAPVTALCEAPGTT
jgi:hypothetical protein